MRLAQGFIHGGWVDGSLWEGVYRSLKKDGYKVSVVQNPTTSLADDVAVTKRAIPVINHGELKGIVSLGDIVKYRLEELELESNVLRDLAVAVR